MEGSGSQGNLQSRIRISDMGLQQVRLSHPVPKTDNSKKNSKNLF